VADFPSVNEQALHLVARELAATLNDVRIALEAAAETPADMAPVARVEVHAQAEDAPPTRVGKRASKAE
jgi:hypothetical protein